MQVHYGEGVAICTGPEPCVGIREGAGEASAGEHIGQPWSRESKKVLGADVVRITEGNNGYVADGLPGGEFDTSTGYPMSKLLARQNS